MQIRRGREADTERLVALAGQIFETEQEIPRALTPLPPENRPQWWCVEEDGTLLGGVALYWEDDACTWAASSSPRNCGGVMLGPRCWKRP